MGLLKHLSGLPEYLSANGFMIREKMRSHRLSVILAMAILAILIILAPACGQKVVQNAASNSTPLPSPCPTFVAAPILPGWTPTLPQSSILPSPQSHVESLLPSIADVVAVVKPSVVVINTQTISYDQYNRPIQELGAGSGWIVDEKGLIVTNNHVVEGASQITVTLDDGRVFGAKEVRTDPLTDLTVLKVDAENLPTTGVGDPSKLRVGDWVVAIGNPLGLGISAKEGIISRFGVTLSVSEGQTLYNLIETSADINPGNSGGPLANMNGEVIGINSAKISSVGVEGMGYAICTADALPVIERLVSTGQVIRPWLGMEYISVDQELVFRYDLATNRGALVTVVVSGGPADGAGIAEGDVIVRFQDMGISGALDLLQAEQSSQIGQQVTLTLWHDNIERDINLVLTESPPCKY